MRAVVPILLSLCLFASAQDEKQSRALAETLRREMRGDFDAKILDSLDALDVARERFYGYYRHADNAKDKKAIKKTFHAIGNRIMKPDRQRVRNVEERLERLERGIRERPEVRSEKA